MLYITCTEIWKVFIFLLFKRRRPICVVAVGAVTCYRECWIFCKLLKVLFSWEISYKFRIKACQNKKLSSHLSYERWHTNKNKVKLNIVTLGGSLTKSGWRKNLLHCAFLEETPVRQLEIRDIIYCCRHPMIQS